LRYFGISDYFDAFEALPLDNLEYYINHKKPHSYMLEKVKEELDADNPLMVGDTSADIKAAENAGIDSVLVQSYSEYENLNPTHRIRNLDELRSIIHS
jgi:phosphoglycolate phosphatase-like HAD superfamily hydrolase